MLNLFKQQLEKITYWLLSEDFHPIAKELSILLNLLFSTTEEVLRKICSKLVSSF